MMPRLTGRDIVETTNDAIAAEPAPWESEALLNANALFRWLVSRGASK